MRPSRVFAAKGYDGASLRAVAREASVDPALVHHYFDGKADLFVAAMALPFDPRSVAAHTAGSSPAAMGHASSGVRHHVGPRRGNGLLLRGVCGGHGRLHERRRRDREFVAERVWGKTPVKQGESDSPTRHALVSSQLIRVWPSSATPAGPPVSTATPEEIGRWAGPTLDRYSSGPVG